MICLKNRTFAVSQTACTKRVRFGQALWFAWKIVLLQYHKQPIELTMKQSERCDLLEKSYFCSITNSCPSCDNLEQGVVICLKNRTFAVSQTAIAFLPFVRFLLWFAWKIVLLQYHKQRANDYTRCIRVVICLKNRTFAVSQTAVWPLLIQRLSCDLLEKSYFCSITNSPSRLISTSSIVVICLKNRTFAVSQTAMRR